MATGKRRCEEIMRLRVSIAAVVLAMCAATAWANGFTLTSRPEITAFPAIVIQPNKPGVVAFDVMPKGNPRENPDNGTVWADYCDADLIANPEAPVVCARIGVKSDRVEFGVRSFGGAAPRPIHIISGGKTVMVIDDAGVTVLGNLRVMGQVIDGR